MLILGVNAFHADASAVLLADGELVAAAEEERFRRVKHCAGFPARAIDACLAESGARLEDVEVVAVNHDPRANAWPRLAFVLRSGAGWSALAARLRRRRERASLGARFDDAFGAGRLRAPIEAVEHHRCHLASAYYGSGFAEALAVSVDGFGDFASAAWGVGRGAGLHVAERVLFPHSLGIYYQALTQYLGFRDYGDEYKVMGLAPYGEPRHVDALRRLVRVQPDGGVRLDLAYFRHATERIDLTWDDGAPRFADLYSPALCELLGPARDPQEELTDRHRDIARSVQTVYEEAFLELLRRVHRRFAVDRLVLSGGCAQNSVANGKIRAATPIRELYVQPAAGDAGGALGAAWCAWNRRFPERRPRPMTHGYWGPGFDDARCAAALRARSAEIAAQGCAEEPIDGEDALCRRVAGMIAGGAVVGWFQGRMEWGPRALGNRSILADPRRGDMRELLNRKIKRREPFRPFAPSVLRECAAEWFEEDAEVPFMTQVASVRESKRAAIPAVTHVDGTGRLQTVTREANALYHRLICAFRELTGVPMLLNTSFNESEPIVCAPEEALDCFLRTRMDALALGTRLVVRGGPGARAPR